MDRKKLLLLIILVIAAAIPLTVFIAQKSQDIRQRAAEVEQSKENQKPKYAEGQVIVKFKLIARRGEKNAQGFRVKPGAGVQSADLDKRVIPFSALDPNSLPSVLSQANQKYKVSTIEKVFKGAGAVPLAQAVQSANTDLSRTYKITFDRRVPVESFLAEFRRSSEVSYAEPNYIYTATATQNPESGKVCPQVISNGVKPDSFECREFSTPCNVPNGWNQFASCPLATSNDPYYIDNYSDFTSNRDSSWDPTYDYQWNLKKIEAGKAWQISTDSAQILVAVVDTGVDYAHPDLGGCTLSQVNSNQCPKVAPGYNFVSENNDPMDDNGHGTHVAGIIAANINNGIGIAGLAPNAKIIPIKGLNNYGNGYNSDLAMGIFDAVLRGAKVINASFGGAGVSAVMIEAITMAHRHNVVTVVAAGNSDSDVKDFYPANTTCASDQNPDADCTITVASTDMSDAKSEFSNWGSGIDIAAPGGHSYWADIISLKSSMLSPTYSSESILGNNYLRMRGTSMAAPHVAALAAMIFGKNQNLTAEEVRNIIINGADDVGTPSFDNFSGYGRINAFRSLSNMDTSIPAIARISSPQPDILIGPKIKIIGSAYGTNFESYTLSYSSSPKSQDEWSTDGVVLANSGRNPVRNGEIAELDLTGKPGDRYYLRLKTNTTNGRSAYTMIPVRFDSTIKSGFPIMFGSPVANIQPAIADINGDGIKEIVYKNQSDSKIYVVQPDGTNLSGWPKETGEPPLGFEIFKVDYSTPVITDLDSSYPGLEVIVPVNRDNPLAWWEEYTGIQLMAFHADGTPVPGWTVEEWIERGALGEFSYDMSFAAGVIQNKNAIVYAEASSGGSSLKVHVFDQSAQDLSGWPMTIESPYGVFKTPIIFDIDNDSSPEILLALWNYSTYSSNSIRIVSSSGSLKKEISTPTGDSIVNTIVGDIDGDGYSEIIASTFTPPPDEGRGVGSLGGDGTTSTPYNAVTKIYVWDHLGNIKSGFPYAITSNISRFNFPYLLNVGDFNNDGNAEILTYFSNEFYLIDKNGSRVSIFTTPEETPYYYYSNAAFGTNVSLTDGTHLLATGDPYFWEGLFLNHFDPASGRLTSVSGFPKNYSVSYGLLGETGYPSLLDIDNDGKLEVVNAAELVNVGWLFKVVSYLYAFDLDYSASNLDWPQYLHDEQHSNVYTSLLSAPSPRPTLTSVPTPAILPQQLKISGGWNLIGLAVDKGSEYLAEDFLRDLNSRLQGLALEPQTNCIVRRGQSTALGRIMSQTVSPSLCSPPSTQGGAIVDVIYRYTNGIYERHEVGSSYNNFPIRIGEAYFVKSIEDVNTSLAGFQSSFASISFTTGWNLFSLPDTTSISSASRLIQVLNQQGIITRELYHWKDGRWGVYIKDTPLDFPLTPGEGYFIRNTGGDKVFRLP